MWREQRNKRGELSSLTTEGFTVRGEINIVGAALHHVAIWHWRTKELRECQIKQHVLKERTPGLIFSLNSAPELQSLGSFDLLSQHCAVISHLP